MGSLLFMNHCNFFFLNRNSLFYDKDLVYTVI